jgi:hypothetical protein
MDFTWTNTGLLQTALEMARTIHSWTTGAMIPLGAMSELLSKLLSWVVEQEKETSRAIRRMVCGEFHLSGQMGVMALLAILKIFLLGILVATPAIAAKVLVVVGYLLCLIIAELTKPLI